jgi:hypothetical protein
VELELRRRFRPWVQYNGPWLSYSESNRGLYWAQPDFVLLQGTSEGLLVEAKLTRCLDAEIQLQQLYGPLARLAWPGRAWRFVAVCYNWAGPLGPIVEPEAVSPGPDVHWWHWRP